ncbi:MAG: hypothetical protein HYV97_17075 [Bdellovibrio sp.]|nr:hypothetical protein [Bdellovibrio sp.]
MKIQFKDLIPAMMWTIVLLILVEIFGTALFPVVGGYKYRLPFNILIILFLGFKLETPFLGLLILVIQLIHALFSIEGWAMGTLAGISVCLVISYLRELIHFNTIWMTMLITQIFQIIWFGIVFGLFYMKNNDMNFLIGRFYRFIPESIVISLLSPSVFYLLDRVWHARDERLLDS